MTNTKMIHLNCDEAAKLMVIMIVSMATLAMCILLKFWKDIK